MLVRTQDKSIILYIIWYWPKSYWGNGGENGTFRIRIADRGSDTSDDDIRKSYLHDDVARAIPIRVWYIYHVVSNIPICIVLKHFCSCTCRTLQIRSTFLNSKQSWRVRTLLTADCSASRRIEPEDFQRLIIISLFCCANRSGINWKYVCAHKITCTSSRAYNVYGVRKYIAICLQYNP